MAKSLEDIVSRVTVDYNMLPWFLYPTNWFAHFPGAPLSRFEKFNHPPKFIADFKTGDYKGKLAKFSRPGDPGKAFYGAAYNDTGASWDPLVEWAQDPPREYGLNDESLPLNRKTALTINPHGGQKIIMSQHAPSFFDSWLGLPFKLPYLLATLPFQIPKIVGGKEILEMGKLYDVEGMHTSGDIKLDQNLLKTAMTLGLGKFYDLRDETGKVHARIKRSPLWKLLTLGLKNRYTVQFYEKATEQQRKNVIGMVDYLQREGAYRLSKPSAQTSLENVFEYL